MSNRDMHLVRLSEGHYCRHPVADESADAKKRQVALSAPRIPLCTPQAKHKYTAPFAQRIWRSLDGSRWTFAIQPYCKGGMAAYVLRGAGSLK